MARTHYVWDPFEDNVIEECDENGDTLVEYETEPDRYGNLISQEREGVASYFHFDGQGSTLALTNEVAEVTDKYAYSAFGETTEQSGSSDNSYRYVGEREYSYDVATNDLYVRRLTYVPHVGRWASVDPLDSQMRASYVYVDNRPLGLVDPSGELSVGAYLHIPASCGQFCTGIDWKLGAGESPGFVIQKLSFTGSAIDCTRSFSAYYATCGTGRDAIRFGPAAAIPATGTLEYWELWPVIDGSLYRTRTERVYPNTFNGVSSRWCACYAAFCNSGSACCS
jgi:RHS repeat-associated protein